MRKMRRVWMILAGCWWAMAPWSVSVAAPAHDPVKVKLAAEEYDAGRRAFRLGDYLRAASHFENAYRDAASPQALRMAIRSRHLAGDFARAATLCGRARAVYADDPETMELVRGVLADAEPQVHRFSITCEPACVLILDERLVQEDAATEHVVYALAGEHSLVAGWGGRGTQAHRVSAVRGGQSSIRFHLPVQQVATPSGATEWESGGAVLQTGQSAAQVESRGWSPYWFVAAAGTTAVLGGVTIWSGVDTLSSPGPDTVRAACVGKGETCPEYQQGQSKERRTNILLISTGGAAAATAMIGVFFTNWRSESVSKGGNTRVVVSPELDGRAAWSVVASGRF